MEKVLRDGVPSHKKTVAWLGAAERWYLWETFYAIVLVLVDSASIICYGYIQKKTFPRLHYPSHFSIETSQTLVETLVETLEPLGQMDW